MKKPRTAYTTAMLIDDNEMDNFINSKMIEGCCFASRVFVHSGAKSAIEYLNNICVLGNEHDNLIPEIIFLDLNMPVMDGFQFVDEFEKFPEQFKKKIKIIMFTTSLNPDDSKKATQAKCIEGFVIKPLSESSLQQLHPQPMIKG